MQYGWAGGCLEVDLTRGKIEKKENDPELTETYLAGKGTNLKLFWDRVSPEVEPFSEENLLIFGAGLLTGTLVPGANRTCVTTKSPQTNLLTYGTFGGFWAPELKQAGYDTIIISGKSPTPVYIWIQNDKVELRDASHLWGKDTFETQKLIREELKMEKAQTVCIGPAGENRVCAASMEHSIGASSSRSGTGAIMGDKKLKAIAVYGTKDINVANTAKLMELCEEIFKDKRGEPVREIIGNYWSFASKLLTHLGAFGNMGSMPFPEAQDLEKIARAHAEFIEKCYDKKELACYNCGVRCKGAMILPNGERIYAKCISWVGLVINCLKLDFDFALRCYQLIESYGMDTLSTGNLVSFAIDLYQKGIIDIEDTDGLELNYGDAECAFKLIGKIARREGIGDILANGIYQAARMIGRGAEEHAFHIKKLELAPFNLSMPLWSVAASVSDRQDFIKMNTDVLEGVVFLSEEEMEAYKKSEYFHFPEELEKYVNRRYVVTDFDEGLPPLLRFQETLHNLLDVAGVCWFLSGYIVYPIFKYDKVVNLIACVTGKDFDVSEANKVSERITNLIRSYNVILGLRRKDDKLPEKIYRQAPPMGLPKIDPSKVEKAVDNYYKLRGWNSEGIPTKEKLEELGMKYVSQELERRGIL